MKLDVRISSIIEEELTIAWSKILDRIEELPDNGDGPNSAPISASSPVGGSSKSKSGSAAVCALPEQYEEQYLAALEIYKDEINHSRVARELGVSIGSAKKYYNRLVNCGYLPRVEKELSEGEKKVVECIFVKKLSLSATAKELDCSITNVVRRRDSALSKGYIPPEEDN